MSKERFIPLNGHILFSEVEQKRSRFEHSEVNPGDKVPRGRVVETDESITDISVEDEFLYRIFQDVPKVKVGDEEFSIIQYTQIYGKFK